MNRYMTLMRRKKGIKYGGSVANLQSPRSEFNSNRGFRLQTELIPRKPRENVGLSDARITDQDDLEEIIVFMIHLVRHLNKFLMKFQA